MNTGASVADDSKALSFGLKFWYGFGQLAVRNLLAAGFYLRASRDLGR